MKRWLLTAGIVLICAIAAATVLWRQLHSGFRARLVAALEQHFKTDVELAEFSVSLFPQVMASGANLIIGNPNPTVASPLIRIESFQAEATIADVVRRSLRLRRVALRGLQVHIPPKRSRSGSQISADKITRSALTIDDLVSDDADLVVHTDKPGRLPLIFHIHRLHLRGFAFDQPTAFDATLINPVPPGVVNTQGRFGPWAPDEPRLTPVSGKYELAKADLSVFNGLAGHLSSRGAFDGQLERIAVQGTTTTPDFQLTKTGHPVELDTVFDAIVDGTNGDTVLNRVAATLLRTTMVATGRVVKVERPDKGRLIEMDVRIDRGRLEDVMRLAVKPEPPPMVGGLGLRTMMVLPPGKRDVIDRLELEGQFSVQSGRFSSSSVQRKIGDLSRRGRGEPQAPISARVFSDLNGSFLLRNGVLKLPKLTFAVDGARVELSGTYAIRSESLNFTGTLQLQAKLSQTVTGFKSFLLKIVDPLFKGRNAGTELPITVQGTVAQPKFGVNVRRALRRR